MKKKLFAFVLAFVACFAMFALTACGGNQTSVNSGAHVGVCVVVEPKSDVMNLDQVSLKTYLDKLEENGEFSYEGKTGDYGFFVETVFNLKATGKYFWALYTDLVTIAGDDAVYSNADWGTYEYNGKTLNSAAYGVSNLPCVEGYTYAFVLSYSNY